MIRINTLQKARTIRRLNSDDISTVLQLCEGNPMYYRYCPPAPSREGIEADMRITPPGITAEDKYYLGIFENQSLVAVLDLIDGYPEPDTAYLGFFMTDSRYQRNGLGTQIICELLEGLRSNGFRFAKLGYITENPQASHFWKKNGFIEESLGKSLNVAADITRAVLDLENIRE